MSHEAGVQYVYWTSYKDDEKAEIQAWKEELERSIVPCDKTIDQFKCFLLDELGMEKVLLSENELNRKKAIFIENHHAEWLQTPLVELPKNRIPNDREQEAWLKCMTQRHQEAMQIPLEDTGLIFSKYRMEYQLECGAMAHIEVTLEKTHYIYEISRGNHGFEKRGRETTAEKAKAETIVEQIMLYKGVSAEDIRTKTQNYQDYVSTLIALRLRHGESVDGLNL